jgi:hypothetical protein
MPPQTHKELLLRNHRDGENYSLHYLQDKFHHEIDFLICKDRKPISMIEVKMSDQVAYKTTQRAESRFIRLSVCYFVPAEAGARLKDLFKTT